MTQLPAKRPYQERFLDNFDRSQLRREVEAVKPRRWAGLRKKYATWALGASLAFGGMGIPMKMAQQATEGVPLKAGSPISSNASDTGLDNAIAKDLEAAGSIAREVATGVAQGVESATVTPLKSVAAASEQTLTLVTENVRKDFFHKEVPFGSVIYQEAKKNNIRPELVAAVVQAESRFKPTARSGAGAIGLMQLVPRTGRWMGARDLTNPTQNIAAGAKYLKYLHERFDGNETKVIAAYNAGEGNVKRFGGVPPFRETRKYVTKVQNYEQDFRNRVDSRVADASTGASDSAGAEVATR
jgi:hypothetical protein